MYFQEFAALQKRLTVRSLDLRLLLIAALVSLLFVFPPAWAQSIPQSVLDQAFQLGERQKAVEDQQADLQARQREAEAAALGPLRELQAQQNLMQNELDTIRRIYNNDRAALAVINGTASGPSNAAAADVARAGQLRAGIASMKERIDAANAEIRSFRAEFNVESNRLQQARTQANLAIRQLRADYLNDRDALAAFDEKLTNGRGELTRAQRAAQDEAARLESQARAQARQQERRQQVEAEAQAKREAPVRDLLREAKDLAPTRLLGEFKPSNDYEQDILTAAIIGAEWEALRKSDLRREPLIAARVQELRAELDRLNEKHQRTMSSRRPFDVQWELLADIYYPDNRNNLIGPLRTIYEPVYERLREEEKQERRQRQAEERGRTITFIIGIFWLLIWLGLFVAAGFLLYRYLKRRAGRHDLTYQATVTEVMSQFGANEAARTKEIDSVFDAKAKTLKATFKHDLGNSTKIEAKLLRSLAASPGREREALRTACHLHNMGEVSTQWFYWHYLALVFGDGKGQFNDYSYQGYEGDSMNEAMKKYLSPYTAESCVSGVLQQLERVTAKHPDNPVIKSLNSRMMSGGGGSGLTSTEQFRASQKPGKYGLILGDAEDTGETIRYYGEGSLISVAPTRSGKTQSQVLPTMLSWTGPAVVLDIKGEIYDLTSKWRSENVGPVYKFSPLSPEETHCYNPLSFVRTEPDYIWGDSRLLADMMIVPSNSSDPFWENEARNVVTAAIAYVCYANPPENRPLQAVLDIMYGGGAYESMILGLKMAVDVRVMMNNAEALSKMNEKTLSSVLQTARGSLAAWADPRIERATSRSDWSPLDLRGDKPPTIYICLTPSEVDSYIPVLRVFIAQHIRMLTSQLPSRDAAPVLFLLDELPRLRNMPPVESALEIGLQYGVKLWMFVQSIGQMQNAYPNADGMIGNCAIRMFMNPSLQDGTAKNLSEQIGMQESVLDGTRSAIVEPNVLAGEEFKDSVIVMSTGMRPMRLRKHFAYQDDELVSRQGRL